MKRRLKKIIVNGYLWCLPKLKKKNTNCSLCFVFLLLCNSWSVFNGQFLCVVVGGGGGGLSLEKVLDHSWRSGAQRALMWTGD